MSFSLKSDALSICVDKQQASAAPTLMQLIEDEHDSARRAALKKTCVRSLVVWRAQPVNVYAKLASREPNDFQCY